MPSEKKPASMLLPMDVAIEIAESLHAIPEAPRFPGALKATARDLCEWCDGADAIPAARWLEAEARRECQVWPGPAGLRAIFDAKFRPNIKPFEPMGQKPPTSCGLCGDTGAREISNLIDGSDRKVWTWCVCEYGTWLRENVPNYLELCNKRATLQEAARRVPLPTQEEIDHIKAEQEANRKERQL
jgi:hypothetical protein